MKPILRGVGLLLHVLAGMAVISIPVCHLAGAEHGLTAFGWTAAVALAVGQFLLLTSRGAPSLTLSHAMVVSAAAWLVVPIVGALPLLLGARAVGGGADVPFATPIDALFESFSGFTGTGLTMSLDPARLSVSAQWWRAFMEWVGGVGVIVLLLAVLRPSTGSYRLYASEGRDEKILPTVASTVRAIWWIYSVYTLACVLALWALRTPFWEALLHGMAAVSTGGFTIRADSTASYSNAARIVLMIGMLAGAISFHRHYALLRDRRWRLLLDAQGRTLLFCLVVGTALLVFDRASSGAPGGVRDDVFHWVSALTTAGFQTSDLSEWPRSSLMLLTVAMVIGGAAGATVGGIKVFRLYVIVKSVGWRFARLARTPHEMPRLQLDGRVVSEAEASRLSEAAAGFVAIWLLVLSAAVYVLVHATGDEYSLEALIFEATSAQANAGLSAGVTDPGLPALAKVVLMLCMWLGRLEILPAVLVGGVVVRWATRARARHLFRASGPRR